MTAIIDQATWLQGRRFYRSLTRRAFTVSGLAALAAGGVPRTASSQTTRTLIKYGHTTGVHELGQYVLPEVLPASIGIDWVDFGSIGTGRLAAMTRGLCEAMTTANTYVVSGRAEGVPVTGICGMAGRGQALVAREDRGINKLEDLKGKRIATAQYSSSHVMLMVVLRAIGLDPSRDVKIVDIGQPAAFNVLLEKGDVDAGLLWEPNVTIVTMKPGIRKLELDRFFQLTWPTHSGTYVLQKLIDEKRDTVQELVTGSVKATALLKSDPEKWITLAERYTTQPRPVLLESIKNCDLRTDHDLTMTYRAAETMFELGIIKKDVAAEMENAFDYSFLMKATGKSKEDLGFVSYADYKAGKKRRI
jgi:ABC-type nitrate/sulfonate/bicarbonate transport system substrate-binding protein